LSKTALNVLNRIKKEQDGALKNVKNGTPCKWIFTGTKRHVPLSNMAMLALLRRMNRRDITVHGFRSSFRDWAAEQTNFPREVAEAALAHAVGDKVEAAYRRSDLFDKRRQMMDAWDRYCATPQAPAGNKVVKIGR
jgi:integrase